MDSAMKMIKDFIKGLMLIALILAAFVIPVITYLATDSVLIAICVALVPLFVMAIYYLVSLRAPIEEKNKLTTVLNDEILDPFKDTESSEFTEVIDEETPHPLFSGYSGDPFVDLTAELSTDR